MVGFYIPRLEPNTLFDIYAACFLFLFAYLTSEDLYDVFRTSLSYALCAVIALDALADTGLGWTYGDGWYASFSWRPLGQVLDALQQNTEVVDGVVRPRNYPRT